jgi:Phorbol esters/diacylglycerol binding domain (C1 domain)
LIYLSSAETSRYSIQVPTVEQQPAQPTENRKDESKHTFVLKEFDSEMQCAVCAELLYPSSLAAQCTTCRLLCHARCMCPHWASGFRVPPCLKNSLSSSSSSSSSMKGTKRKKDTLDQEDLEEYTSHQWSPFLNLSANWCSHCGYSLSLGQGNQEGANRQCEACKITCHAQCQDLVGKRCDLQHAPPYSSIAGHYEPLNEWFPHLRKPQPKTASRARIR